MSGYHPTKMIVAALLAVCVCIPVAHGQTPVYFMKAGYKLGGAATPVSGRANVPAMCSVRRGLKGLDLVRGFAGVAVCPGTQIDQKFKVNMDYVILIDDTRPLSRSLQRDLESRNRLQSYKGRKVVLPGVVSMRRDENGAAVSMNVLIVGEMTFRQLGSDESKWYEYLLDRTGGGACALPQADRNTIGEYALQVFQLNISIKLAMSAAVDNFATSMKFASSYESKPKIGAAILCTAIDEAKDIAVDKMSDVVPGVGFIVAMYDSMQEENKRAEAAGDSYAMSEWITRAQTIIGDCTGNSLCDESDNGSVSVKSSVTIKRDIEAAICRLPENRRVAGVDAVSQALENSLRQGRPGIRVFEKDIFESWINSHYDETAARGPDPIEGTIEIRWATEWKGAAGLGGMTLAKATVNVAQYGEHADGGLNVIIDALPAVGGPLDIKVRKRVCFENKYSKGEPICWLLDKDNAVLRSKYESYYSINDHSYSRRSAFAGPPTAEDKEREENRKRELKDAAERRFSGNNWRGVLKRFKK